MSNVFRSSHDKNNNIRKNTFPLSFTNNLTTRFGRIVPAAFFDLVPGSSLKIDPKMSFNFMPMLYPVQTPVKASLHFFKVRKRSLWSGFMDYFGKTPKSKNLVKPYINADNYNVFKNSFMTSSLGDYLGLPTTVVGNYGSIEERKFKFFDVYSDKLRSSRFTKFSSDSIPRNSFNFVSNPIVIEKPKDSSTYNKARMYLYLRVDTTQTQDFNSFEFDYKAFYPSGTSSDFLALLPKFFANGLLTKMYQRDTGKVVDFSNITYNFTLTDDYKLKLVIDEETGLSHFTNYIKAGNDLIVIVPIDAELGVVNQFEFPFKVEPVMDHVTVVGQKFLSYENGDLITNQFAYYNGDAVVELGQPEVGLIDLNYTNDFNSALPTYEVTRESYEDVEDVSFQSNCYAGSEKNDDRYIKIDAMPFRAYESIYNSFYRNILNDPYKINGEIEYNQFIPSLDGGIDDNVYEIRYRNWDDDFLTTALPNPQYGEFPVLVGITNTDGKGAGFSVRDEDGTNYHLKPVMSEDGKSITSFTITDLPDGAVISNPSSYIDMVDAGISITDIRTANALQVWLELNARKGMRFKDLVKGRFDTDIRFDELNMPEFVGGITGSMQMTAVDQTFSQQRVGTFDEVLGSFAGQGYISGQGSPITVYCDEPCYVIGLLSIVPMASYSQLLPKHFTYRDILDEFSPEFSHIGYQPILYRDVCPNQAFNAKEDLKTVFGYQRAYWEYISKVDEVHGDYRKSLRDFLINRVFNTAPKLGSNFLHVDPEQVNDVFSVTTDEDKILGQIYFDVTLIGPFPTDGVPSLDVK